MSTLRYMGSKRSLAPAIAGLINEAHPGAVVADAFAGTCAIGMAAARNHRVIANDVHKFAEIIARALLVAPGRPPTRREAESDLRDIALAHAAEIAPWVEERVMRERAALERFF